MHYTPPRWIMLRTEPGKFPVVTDSSNDIFGGVPELRALIDNYIYDDPEGTVYTIIDCERGIIVESHRIEVVKRAVRA